ncbi:MAG: putative membrane protein [Candidatus Nanosalina sp. J07AB43]|nr:MAG: putative membrane protein [Candidatus Nanosalina sp. J07AB43]
MVFQLLAPLFSFYDSVFQSLVDCWTLCVAGIFSAALAALFAVIYWFLLDVERADEIKDKLNKYQDKMKEARENDNDDEASKHLKKTLQLNQKFMMLNIKPMLATIVFVGLFFPWLGNTYAPNVEMNQTDNSTFSGQLQYAGDTQELRVSNRSSILVESGNATAGIKEDIEVLDVRWQVASFQKLQGESSDTRLKLNAEFIPLPVNLPFVGNALNWLGFYFILIMPLTYVFRKLLGVQ